MPANLARPTRLLVRLSNVVGLDHLVEHGSDVVEILVHVLDGKAPADGALQMGSGIGQASEVCLANVRTNSDGFTVLSSIY